MSIWKDQKHVKLVNSWWARSLALRFAETTPSQIGNACKSTWNRCALCNYIHPQEQGLCLGVWCIVFVFAYSQHRIYLETEWQCRHHRTEPLLLLTLVSLPTMAVLTSLYSMYHQYVMILYSIFNFVAYLSTIALLASFVFLVYWKLSSSLKFTLLTLFSFLYRIAKQAECHHRSPITDFWRKLQFVSWEYPVDHNIHNKRRKSSFNQDLNLLSKIFLTIM